MAAYYNDNDPLVCAWLRELIKAGLIAPGEVDERSIKDVHADDLKGFTQHHFFAGIGGWSYALRLAGWSDDRPVWTGSCPCQPFSGAGKGLGEKDPRHLWPDWFRLIGECGPTVIFGEQVAHPRGRKWLSGVRASLEILGYAVGAADLCAAGVASPQIRQRLWWVGISNGAGSQPGEQAASIARHGSTSIPASGAGRLSNTRRNRRQQSAESIRRGKSEPARIDEIGGLRNPAKQGRRSAREPGEAVPQPETVERLARSGDAGFWDDFDLLPFRDGKARRVEPGTFPLAHGVPARVGRLRGYGNAINPQTAAQFIRAVSLI